MKLKTFGDVKNHLLMVTDFATHHPTLGNPSISKEKYWHMIMVTCKEENEAKECGEVISNAVMKEFPQHLRPDFYSGESYDEFYDESYIGL